MPEEEAVGVTLADIVQKRPHSSLPLGKRVVEKREAAKSDLTMDCPPEHPGHGCAGYNQGNEGGGKPGDSLRQSKSDLFRAQAQAQLLIRGAEVLAQAEEPDLGRCLACCQEPIIVFAFALVPGGALPELVLADRVAYHD